MRANRGGWSMGVALLLAACPGGSAEPTGDVTSGETGAATGTTATGSEPHGTSSGETSSPTSGPASDDTAAPTCSAADCAPGEYCDGVACVPGCDADDDCMGVGVCDVPAHACVTSCVDDAGCAGNQSCCDEVCVFVDFNPLHCGGCMPCPALANAESDCAVGTCGFGGCVAGFFDCDGEHANGCETSEPCMCIPGEQVGCYGGPDGTLDVGTCVAGVMTCDASGLGFGACVGEVVPAGVDACDGMDDDCNGAIDDLDADGDGWSACGDDCCDAVESGCPVPAEVNPGAFEYPGNGVDDDCDPGTPEDSNAECDAGLSSAPVDVGDYARALELCRVTVEDPPLAERTWGVISARLSRTDGVQAAHPTGAAIRDRFGPNVPAKRGQRLAALSTGNAAAPNQANPPFVKFQPGQALAADSEAPVDWLAANGGSFPVTPPCPAAPDAVARDSVMLTLRVRVPTNARSFTVKADFFSADWPEWACTPVDDMFVALLDSAAPDVPDDKNLAVFVAPDEVRHPVTVNLGRVQAELFGVCFSGTAGCNGTPFNSVCVLGTQELAGSGFAEPGDTGCGNNDTTGGSTSWLTITGNVVPGETIELRLAIWDVANGLSDSVILLDDWRWSAEAATPGLLSSSE